MTNIANNHSYDYGEQSFLDTVDILERKGIAAFGYNDVKVIPVKGVNVGLCGIYELDDYLERIPQVKKNIAALKESGGILSLQFSIGEMNWRQFRTVTI